MKKWTSRVLVTMFLGLTGVVGVAVPAHADGWVHTTTNPYPSEEACNAAGERYVSHYCTLTTYPKCGARCGVRGWYLSYFMS
ncbi:hypothetical protein AB0877_31605 [Micromonospora sp. NPDC047644]|uniref:hypothetical protein n=1 Tax=Micromonospora sp. NPDC047644 TaxID=3157203 RepID=UPI0034518085